ncbi:hypothetical protein GCM10009624_16090 [Gordonia sinesedis]
MTAQSESHVDPIRRGWTVTSVPGAGATERRPRRPRHARRARWDVIALRVSILLVVASALWFTPWMLAHLDLDRPWLSIPFAAAFLVVLAQLFVAMFNNWTWAEGFRTLVVPGTEPDVGVIIPTCGESPDMVYWTVHSVVSQDWPTDRLVVVVSDDAANPEMESIVATIAASFPDLRIHYHIPARRGSAERQGDAKAGNLNSAYGFLDATHPEVEFVETRDADDALTEPQFLRHTVAPLMRTRRMAYVQTIKDCHTSPGDPFNNREELFYRGIMRAKLSANALFPCGSGLVWRRRALIDIGGFPSWNLVEDLQSGVEALRRGWQCGYVPIVGARAQHSPEDLANVYKQRGTWALDTMRLLIWRPMAGLGFRQRMQFIEMGLFYCQGFALMALTGLSIVFVLTGTQPVAQPMTTYMIHFVPYIIAVELFMLTMCRTTRVSNYFAFRRMWYGMMFVNMKAAIMALLWGPNRKPVYKVTRKENVNRWYWRLTLPHIVVVLVIVVALIVGAYRHGSSAILRADTLYWVVMTVLPLAAFIPLGWFGMSPARRITDTVLRRDAVGTASVES